MRDFFKLFRRYIEGEQTEVSWNKIEPLPNEVVRTHINSKILYKKVSRFLVSFQKVSSKISKILRAWYLKFQLK